jgi:hypothetical protein
MNSPDIVAEAEEEPQAAKEKPPVSGPAAFLGIVLTNALNRGC